MESVRRPEVFSVLAAAYVGEPPALPPYQRLLHKVSLVLSEIGRDNPNERLQASSLNLVKLAFLFRDANEKYATDYPAAVGHHMTNTDSSEFMNLVPAVSLRENERGMQIGAGWNPQYHQPTDRYSAYSDKDFRLGLNAAQTSLAAIARLSGAILSR